MPKASCMNDKAYIILNISDFGPFLVRFRESLRLGLIGTRVLLLLLTGKHKPTQRASAVGGVHNASITSQILCITQHRIHQRFKIITSVTNMKLMPSFPLLLAAVLFSAIPGSGALSDAEMVSACSVVVHVPYMMLILLLSLLLCADTDTS